MAAYTFPTGFVWGTATASHQVEGGNWNNDWWAWEHNPDSRVAEPSGDACDHYHRYRDDVALLAGLGFTAYRFSLEWSRIEPEEGEFSLAALHHYRRMCEAVRERGMEPIVTFHHFTTPRWLAAKGGWLNAATAEHFARFCGTAAEHLGDLIDRACTINEPNVVATHGQLNGTFPPGNRDAGLRDQANAVLIDAHRGARRAIREVDDRIAVGLTMAMSEWTAVDDGHRMRAAQRRDWEDVFFDAVQGDDFIGVQTYTRYRVGPDGRLGPEPGAEVTQMGYEFRPQALEATIRRAWQVTGLPILVTENGIATADDERRISYVATALRGVARCIDDGIPVSGYVYWSALDNFEWHLGYDPTFGLVAVDRQTQARTVKPSARWLGGVARANSLAE